MRTIGIDLGGHTISAASIAFAETPTIGERIILPTPQARKESEVLSALAKIICTLCREEKICTIGIGLPGFIARDRRRINKLTNFPMFENIDFVDRMECVLRNEGIESRLFIDNDANCFALGEGALGAAKGMKDYVVLTLGTGVGAGLVANGRLICGANGIAGEPGHIPILGSLSCNCGGISHIETYAGADSVEREARKLGLPEDFALLWNRRDEPLYKELIDSVIDALARCIASLMVVLDPEIIVLNGGLSQADGIAEVLKLAALPYLPIPSRSAFRVEVSTLGSDAGLYGAALLPMQER